MLQNVKRLLGHRFYRRDEFTDPLLQNAQDVIVSSTPCDFAVRSIADLDVLLANAEKKSHCVPEISGQSVAGIRECVPKIPAPVPRRPPVRPY